MKGKPAEKAPRKKNSTKPTKSVSMKDQEQAVLDIGGQVEQPGPVTVVNGRILAEYVKPHFSRDRNDDRFVGLEFAVKLTEAHKLILPQRVLDAWSFVANGGGQGVKDISLEPQTVDIYLTADKLADVEVKIVGGIIEHAKVDIVEERGAGEAVKFTRYSFRVVDERSKNLIAFACWKDGVAVWLDMKPTQASML